MFEDSQTAVLIQSGNEILRVPMQDGEALDKIITAFINYVRPEVKDFRTAIGAFKQDLPKILDALRDTIERQNESNATFRECRNNFGRFAKINQS
ncbi:MAG: hypothetical protein N4J56_004871 [Chroococcidiopsis sp. SAG 2025]|nr:hypothetical protein [Chroococcidiopsis sp. SAG 2025]